MAKWMISMVCDENRNTASRNTIHKSWWPSRKTPRTQAKGGSSQSAEILFKFHLTIVNDNVWVERLILIQVGEPLSYTMTVRVVIMIKPFPMNGSCKENAAVMDKRACSLSGKDFVRKVKRWWWRYNQIFLPYVTWASSRIFTIIL